MKERGSKAILAGLLVLIHVGLSWWYGRLLPWGGDEWYTYDGRTLMAVPNTILIEIARFLLGEVTPGNYMFYRLTGVVWGCLTIAGLFLLGASDKRYSFLVPASLFLAISPFVFHQEQYFRYYGYYLAASFGVFLLILHLDADYRRKRWVFWGLLLVSPFLYLFIGLQIACYVAFREWICLSKKGRWVVAGLGIVGLLIVVSSWSWLIQMGMEFAFSGMTSAAGNEAVLRGFSPGLLVKPIYFVFEGFWGYHVEPTENRWIFVLVIWLFVFLGIRFLMFARRNVPITMLLVVNLVLPLAVIYLFLEPLTPPGATQLESKHALFGFPWLLMLAFDRTRIRGGRLGMISVFGISMIALWFALGRNRPAWPAIVDEAVSVVETEGRVILDGRSNRTFRFYADGRVDPTAIDTIGEWEGLNFLSNGEEGEVLVVHNDWKAYQHLSLKQNWNSGEDSAAKVGAIAELESILSGGDYRASWSFVRFPLHAFRYVRSPTGKSMIPSVLPIPYRDLAFPVEVGGQVLIGAARVVPESSAIAFWSEGGRLEIFGFVRGAGELVEGEEIGRAILSDRTIPIQLGTRPSSGYQADHSRGWQGSTVVGGWHKRPLISQSARYEGSFLPNEGIIYRAFIEAEGPIELQVNRPGVEWVVLVPDPKL